jgi:hypothetical protein
MGTVGSAWSYAILGVIACILIFAGAFFFVQASRRGNRRFKWWRGRRNGESATQDGGSSRGS